MAAPAVGGAALTRRGFLVATAASLVAACGRDDESTTEPNLDAPELVLGVSLELTGAGAVLGVPQERALRITMESLNEQGVPVGNLRRTVRVVIKDNASDPKVAAQQAAEMARQDNVHALIGGCVAETSLAIVGVAQDQQIPFISFAHADNLLVPISLRRYIFKLTPDASDVARALARLIRDQGLRRVGVLLAGGAHGAAGRQALAGALRTTERSIGRVEQIPLGETDFGPAARRVAREENDAVIIWATAPDSGAAARALKEAGYTGRIFFDSGAVAEETLSATNVPAVEGAYAVHPSSLSGSSLTNTSTAGLARRDFVFRYIQRNGSFTGFAPYASDAVQLIANAARLANSVDRGRLRTYLEQQITEGIAGAYSFAPIKHGGMEPDSLGTFVVAKGAWSRVS